MPLAGRKKKASGVVDVPPGTELTSLPTARELYGDVVTKKTPEAGWTAHGGESTSKKTKMKRSASRPRSKGNNLPPVKAVVHSPPPGGAPEKQAPQQSLPRPPRKRRRERPQSNPKRNEHDSLPGNAASKGCQPSENKKDDAGRGLPSDKLGVDGTSVGVEAQEVGGTLTAPGSTGRPSAARALSNNADESKASPPRKYFGDGQTTQLLTASSGSIASDESVSVASSLATAESKRGGSIDTTAAGKPACRGSRTAPRRVNRKRLGRETGRQCHGTVKAIKATGAPCTLGNEWCMTHRGIQRHIRQLTLDRQPGITRVLEAVAAQIGHNSNGTRDFFKLVSAQSSRRQKVGQLL